MWTKKRKKEEVNFKRAKCQTRWVSSDTYSTIPKLKQNNYLGK